MVLYSMKLSDYTIGTLLCIITFFQITILYNQLFLKVPKPTNRVFIENYNYIANNVSAKTILFS